MTTDLTLHDFPSRAAAASRPRPVRHAWRAAAAGIALLLLSGCILDDDSTDATPEAPVTPVEPVVPPDPLTPYRQQALHWTACPPAWIPNDQQAAALLGDRLTCTTMRVPQDYANPGAGDLHIALLRVAAEQPQARRGAIAFNPGGPGGDGLNDPMDTAELLTLANPDSALGSRLRTISQQYDLIGFSPRGVGASTQFTCESDEIERPTFADAALRTPTVVEDMQHNARIAAQACQQNPMAPFIGTAQVVQDMDLMRTLLQDDKLNYLGTSYGTWLGAWYASQFPDRAGRVILDSNMNLASDFQDAMLTQPAGFQRVLDQVLAPYAARHDAIYNLGSEQDVRDLMRNTLRPEVREAVRPLLQLSSNSAADETLAALLGASGLESILQQSPGIPDLGTLQQAVLQHTFSQDDDTNNQARGAGYSILQAMFHPKPPVPLELDDEGAVNLAVKCNDTAFNHDPQFWRDAGAQQAIASPVVGDNTTDEPCVYWQLPPAVKPSLTAMAGLEILMLQSQFDGATPTEGALLGFAQLPNAKMVYVPGEYQHGLFPYNDDCLDDAVARYLLGEAPADRTVTCAAKALPHDAADPAGRRLAAAGDSHAASTYIDPQRAAQVIERIHRKRSSLATRIVR